MSWVASKWHLQIREKATWCGKDSPNDALNYTRHETREEAVTALIEREQAAIALDEAALNRHKARLAKFMKKEGRPSPHGDAP